MLRLWRIVKAELDERAKRKSRYRAATRAAELREAIKVESGVLPDSAPYIREQRNLT